MPADLAHLEAMAVVENDGAFAAAFTDDFANLADVDDGGAVDADEFAGVEGFGELLDGLAEQVVFCADVKAGVIIGGFDPFDFVERDEHVFGSVSDEEAFRVSFIFGRRCGADAVED